jgi:hypothetical protein
MLQHVVDAQSVHGVPGRVDVRVGVIHRGLKHER